VLNALRTESVNNPIKKIEKAGRGYKFDVLRDRCMLSINNPAPDKFDYKKAIYIKKGEQHTFMKKQETLYELANHIVPKTLPEGFDGSVNMITLCHQYHTGMIDYIQRVGRAKRI
jgi:hypothetical protein